jgi:hypothetical protein
MWAEALIDWLRHGHDWHWAALELGGFKFYLLSSDTLYIDNSMDQHFSQWRGDCDLAAVRIRQGDSECQDLCCRWQPCRLPDSGPENNQ